MAKHQLRFQNEMPIQVLKESNRRAQNKSYVWVVRTGEDRDVPIILFHYTPTRKGSNAADFLKGATGTTMFALIHAVSPLYKSGNHEERHHV